MTALGARGLVASRRLHGLAAALLLVAGVAFTASWAVADEATPAPVPVALRPPSNEVIPVLLDQARIIKLPERAATLVLGDPLIADVSIQPGGLAVITGKSYGSTNLVVFDRGGAVLLERNLEVKGPPDPIVIVYRGVARSTYSCTPQCSPRIGLGDDPDFFDKALAQSTTRSTQALSAGAGAH
jgi:Pilus formation protein N terminal region